MKTVACILLLLVSILLCLPFARGQEYTYSITDNGDSTFQYERATTGIIEGVVNVVRFISLDSNALQSRVYAEVNEAYDQMARKMVEFDNLRRQRNGLLSALNEHGLNDYNNAARVRLDSAWSGDVIYRNANEVIDCLVEQRDNNGPFIRRVSDNVRVLTAIPRSRNYLICNFNTGAGFGQGVSSVELYSSNGRFYSGEDSNGLRHVLVFK